MTLWFGVLALQCLLIHGLDLRSSQMPFFMPAPGINLTMQLLQQSLRSMTDTVAAYFLQQLYPSNYQQVLAEINTCEAQYFQQHANDMWTITVDWQRYFTSCFTGDAPAAVSQLLQDTFNTMTFPDCEYSVNLVGDIENLIAASIVQGFQYTGQWTQPLSQWSLLLSEGVSTAALLGSPLNQLVDSLAQQNDIPTEAIDQFAMDGSSNLISWGTLLVDLSTSGQLSQADVADVINTELTVLGDVGRAAGEIVQAGTDLLNQLEPLLCLMIEPLGPWQSMMQPKGNSYETLSPQV